MTEAPNYPVGGTSTLGPIRTYPDGPGSTTGPKPHGVILTAEAVDVPETAPTISDPIPGEPTP